MYNFKLRYFSSFSYTHLLSCEMYKGSSNSLQKWKQITKYNSLIFFFVPSFVVPCPIIVINVRMHFSTCLSYLLIHKKQIICIKTNFCSKQIEPVFTTNKSQYKNFTKHRIEERKKKKNNPKGNFSFRLRFFFSFILRRGYSGIIPVSG